MPNFQIGASIIFKTNWVKFSEKIGKQHYLGNNSIMKKARKKKRKLKKEAEILGMFCAHDNRAISLDHLFASIIHHFRPYFQCWLAENNFKSETNMEYTKLSKARDNNQKSESSTIVKKRQQACDDFEIIGCKPLFLFSLNSKTNLWIKFSFIFIENFAISFFRNYQEFRYVKFSE